MNSEVVVLSEPETAAMDHLCNFVKVMCKEVIGHGQTREHDIAELVDKVHQLQAVVMAQACARLLPDEYRLLGETLRKATSE